jgi:hypothetical protein
MACREPHEGWMEGGVVRKAEAMSVVPETLVLSQWFEAFVGGILVERVPDVTVPYQVHVVLQSVNGHVEKSVDVDVLMVWAA